jgi:hypothetical protein
MKPTKKQRDVADHFISVLRAFKQGKKIQQKRMMVPEWMDVDLWKCMNPKHAVKYRIKP